MTRRLSVPTFAEAPLAFKGARFDVHTLQLPAKGKTFVQRDVVVHPGAVVILPLLDQDQIVMIRNKRFAVGQELLELPAGTLEQGESPLETAKRELIEETGYRPSKINPLTSFYPSPGICNEAMYAYAASGLEHVGQMLDDSEQITVEIVRWEKALQMVREGIIIDGKTITTLLYYHLFSL